MQRYELATLTTTIGAAAKAGPAIEAFCKDGDAKGRLLGAWATDIGGLNRIVLLRGFESDGDLRTERMRTLLSSSPFGGAEWLTGLSLDAYTPFANLPPVPSGSLGAVYEIRTYILKIGGLTPTLEAWQAALPERLKISPIVIAMHALDGPPRFTHIWPYASLNDRAATRADAVAKGIWPPKGGPLWLHEMTSTIGIPMGISPLR